MATSGWEQVTEADARRMGRRDAGNRQGSDSGSIKSPDKGKGRSKYGAVKTAVGAFEFDSKREAHRYCQLRSMEDAGLIANLTLQPPYPVYVVAKDGRQAFICEWRGDFRYNHEGRAVIEDVKSPATRTPVYKLKKKLVEALYGITINEV